MGLAVRRASLDGTFRLNPVCSDTRGYGAFGMWTVRISLFAGSQR